MKGDRLMSLHPSRSDEQQEAGRALINVLSSYLGVPLRGERLDFGDGCTVEIDGYSDDPPIFCEAYAHFGRLKGGQPDKVMTDAFKLVLAEKLLGKTYRKILLFSDEAVEKHFMGKGWQAYCLRYHDIEVIVLPLPDELSKRVQGARRRQHR
ncbi:hypothetical protein ACFLWY_03350 [Chloroflexota bacterium]